jgi:hypothetical protein
MAATAVSWSRTRRGKRARAAGGGAFSRGGSPVGGRKKRGRRPPGGLWGAPRGGEACTASRRRPRLRGPRPCRGRAPAPRARGPPPPPPPPRPRPQAHPEAGPPSPAPPRLRPRSAPRLLLVTFGKGGAPRTCVQARGARRPATARAGAAGGGRPAAAATLGGGDRGRRALVRPARGRGRGLERRGRDGPGGWGEGYKPGAAGCGARAPRRRPPVSGQAAARVHALAASGSAGAASFFLPPKAV